MSACHRIGSPLPLCAERMNLPLRLAIDNRHGNKGRTDAQFF